MKEKKYLCYFSTDGREYTIVRLGDNVKVESGIFNTKATARKEAKKRLRYFEERQGAMSHG
jgi:hypothetical protein